MSLPSSQEVPSIPLSEGPGMASSSPPLVLSQVQRDATALLSQVLEQRSLLHADLEAICHLRVEVADARARCNGAGMLLAEASEATGTAVARSNKLLSRCESDEAPKIADASAMTQ
jgi:hypothetical protein